MLKKECLIVALALLLSIGLTGTAFATGIGSNELDESDYAKSDFFDSSQQVDRSYRPEVEQYNALPSAFASGMNSNELDARDYAKSDFFDSNQQVDRSYRPEVVQYNEYNAWSSAFPSGMHSNELDVSDYAQWNLDNSGIEDPNSVHCAEHSGSGAVAQMKDCG